MSFNKGIIVEARSVDIESLPDHKKPDRVRDEIPTLNKFGYMKSELEEFSGAFINYAQYALNPILEIGPAYGWITHRALEAGAKVVATDISKEHLEVLLKDTPKDKLDNLSVMWGKFPDEVDFPEGYFDIILASRIFHFLEGVEVEEGLDKVYKWLSRGGKFICTNCSIYHSSVKGKMQSIFEKRIANKKKWPGIVRSHQEQDEVHKEYSRDFLNVFHIPQLEELLPQHGFKIDRINLFDYPSDPWPDDDKGHIGFIATKL